MKRGWPVICCDAQPKQEFDYTVHFRFQKGKAGRESLDYFCKFMQTHEWMRRRQQQPRNGNRGEDRFRPCFYYLWISFKNSTLYIHTDCTVCCTHTLTHIYVHTRQWEPSGSVSELKHLEICEYRHHTGSAALFAFPLPGRAAEGEHPLFTSILMKQRMWSSLSWDWHFFCVAVGAALHARLEWMQLALLWWWAAYELCTDGEIGREGVGWGGWM